MILNILTFIGCTVILSLIQFFGLWIYLKISKQIPTPVTMGGQITIGVAWLLMVVFVGVVGYFGIKSVDYSNVPVNRAIGVIPIALGFLFSVLRYRTDWKEFSQKYQKKNQ